METAARRSGRGHAQALSQAAHPATTAAGAISRPAASNRKAELDRLLGKRMPPTCAATRMIDLAVVSVLLDAGAGPDWHYVEPATGQTLHALRGPGAWRASMPSPPACFPATGTSRCRPMPRACAAWSPSTWPRRSRSASQPAGRPRRARRAAAPAGRGDAEQPEVFGDDGRPGGLFDMLRQPAGPGRSAHGRRRRPTTSCRSS